LKALKNYVLPDRLIIVHNLSMHKLDCDNVSDEPRQQGLIWVARFFLVQNTKNGEKYTKLAQNIPNGHKIFPMAVK
jgi:hypothetical protein